MIPSTLQIKELWDVYTLPPVKRNHSETVARLAAWFARQFTNAQPTQKIHTELLVAAALLHDIDKMIPRNPGEHHPDTGVRILRERGFDEVADLVRTHSLSAILDQTVAPTSIEQKILYLSDKMVKHSIIGVDERFALWRNENIPPQAKAELDAAYPKVKALEKEICASISVDPGHIVQLANADETSTMNLS